MYDNVKNVTITYQYKEKEVFILYGFPQEISISVYHMCVTDTEYAIAYFPALLWLSFSVSAKSFKKKIIIV